MHFEEEVKGKFIRFKEVEQDWDGDQFAAAYIDDGTFKIRTFQVPLHHEEGAC